jgi:hypothetical protein
MFAVKHFFASAAQTMMRNDMAAFQLSLHKARNIIGLATQQTTMPMAGHHASHGSTVTAKQGFKAVRQLTAARGIRGHVEAALIAKKAVRSARRMQTRTEPRA